MSSSFVLYHNQDKQLSFFYLADWSEGLTQDLVEGPSLEAFAIQPIFAFPSYLAFHQTTGLMRQAIRGALESFLTHREGLSYEEAQNELLPSLLSTLRDDLLLPDSKLAPPFNLVVLATPGEQIFQLRSDGSIIVYPDIYFSSKEAEAQCRGNDSPLTDENIKRNMTMAAVGYYNGTQLYRLTISGRVQSNCYAVTNFRGETRAFIKVLMDGKGFFFKCVYF